MDIEEVNAALEAAPRPAAPPPCRPASKGVVTPLDGDSHC